MLSRYEKGLLMILLIASISGGMVWVNYFRINTKIKLEENRKAEYSRSSALALGALTLEARAVSVYDLTLGGEVYGVNSDQILPLASLTKIVSIPLAISEDQTPVTISKDMLSYPGDEGLVVGERFSARELAKIALVASSNDATMALSERVPDLIQKMNAKARRLGASNTVFMSSTGLDNGAVPSALGTAKDVNILAYQALVSDADLFQSTTHSVVDISSDLFTHTIKNTNEVLTFLPQVLLSKTGYTASAGGNLVIIFQKQDGHIIAVTLLGSGYKTRFEDMVKIVNAIYNIKYVTS